MIKIIAAEDLFSVTEYKHIFCCLKHLPFLMLDNVWIVGTENSRLRHVVKYIHVKTFHVPEKYFCFNREYYK